MLLAGSVLDRLPGPKYCSALRFAEYRPQAPLPRMPTLRRQRGQCPDGLVVALRAPPAAIGKDIGALRLDADLEAGRRWLIGAADAVSARAVILPTPVQVTSGQRSRDRLRAYVDGLPRDTNIRWVWAPSGPWDPEDAQEFAQTLGLTCVFDPTRDPRPEGEFSYARLQALGAQTTFSEATLESVLEVVGAAGDSLVAIDSQRSFAQAQVLQRLADADGEHTES